MSTSARRVAWALADLSIAIDLRHGDGPIRLPAHVRVPSPAAAPCEAKQACARAMPRWLSPAALRLYHRLNPAGQRGRAARRSILCPPGTPNRPDPRRRSTRRFVDLADGPLIKRPRASTPPPARIAAAAERRRIEWGGGGAERERERDEPARIEIRQLGTAAAASARRLGRPSDPTPIPRGGHHEAAAVVVGLDDLGSIGTVCAAIAAMTMAGGDQRPFAYGTTTGFPAWRAGGDDDDDDDAALAERCRVTDPAKPLLMPLLLPDPLEHDRTPATSATPVDADCPPPGRVVLVIAEPAAAGHAHEHDVELRIWDSGNRDVDGSGSATQAQRAATTLIRRSDWRPRRDQAPRKMPADWSFQVHVHVQPAPIVHRLAHTGVHMILTGWAYALGYPLSHLRRHARYGDDGDGDDDGDDDDDDGDDDPASFYPSAVRPINLGVRGCLDAATVVAFPARVQLRPLVRGGQRLAAGGRAAVARPMLGPHAFDDAVAELLRERRPSPPLTAAAVVVRRSAAAAHDEDSTSGGSGGSGGRAQDDGGYPVANGASPRGGGVVDGK
ncbi:MAG: hypothetical protein M1826_000330 [Phylliscum demangeonii]|nr:MAG: hypothetical protein M1826_000330 [Phylliscum demangeonii]